MIEQDEKTFSLEELSALTETPPRTVRFYIQRGLLDRPDGVGRGARYGVGHARRLMEIRKWKDAGLSLERIHDILVGSGQTEVPPRARKAGDLEVVSRLILKDGVELLIEPKAAGLSVEDVRTLAQGVLDLLAEITSGKQD